jgi:hypothetical protein
MELKFLPGLMKSDVASEMPLYLESIGFPVACIGILEGIVAETAGLSENYAAFEGKSHGWL